MGAQANTAILLMGATASGKTALACALCDRYPLEIVSVDSAQVFRDMNIGTAKPDFETLQKYPHHLINLISPEEAYSAAQFCEDATRVMAEITARGKTPLLVGGTMLYFRALQEGLSDLPKANPEVRARIDETAKNLGWAELHKALLKIDPITAQRLAPTDAQRIQRALEVFEVSGKPLSFWLAQEKPETHNHRFLSLGLFLEDRAQLHQRIAERFCLMLAQGLEEEVAQLRARYRLSLDLPSMRSVGYRQVFETQMGYFPQKDVKERGIAATRQLAKRQITWMKNTLQPELLASDDPALLKKAAQKIERFWAAIHAAVPSTF